MIFKAFRHQTTFMHMLGQIWHAHCWR